MPQRDPEDRIQKIRCFTAIYTPKHPESKKRGYAVIFGSLHLRVFRKGARTLGLIRQTQQTNHFPELPFNPPPLGLQNLDFKTLNRRTTI